MVKRTAPPSSVLGGPTPRQKEFIRSLLGDLYRNESWFLNKSLDDYTVPEASVLIDQLLQEVNAKKQKEADQARSDRKYGKPRDLTIVQDGMYQSPAGIIFKVQYAVHGSGRLYAKQLLPPVQYGGKASFVYEPGLIRKIKPEWRMTLEQAKAFGALYGTCCICGRTLTNEVSIEAGIGPVCAGRL